MRFDSYHPGLNLLFFVAVIAAALAWNHPVFVGVGFVCALIYSFALKGRKAVLFALVALVFPFAWSAWFAYNTHFGITNLGETIIGNRITLESLAYGFVQGAQISTACLWMTCVFKLFTADKVVYLLGRVSPRLSLMLAVALRAIPMVADRTHRIDTAQKAIGRGSGCGNLLDRAHNWVRRVSIIVSWSIERFAEMSDSMRSRGSLLRGRTAYSLYRFDARDRSLVITMVVLITICIAGMLLTQTAIQYNPQVIFNRMTPLSFVFYGAYLVFCLLPCVLQITGEWHFKKQISHVEPAEAPQGMFTE
ncbi:MAG: energy-coupling factor transporter transmembrane component T [Eggerthellales bacterium]|nr:energy-coupling factor transporter transmembrane component T [Eggerthellales bacterium]